MLNHYHPFVLPFTIGFFSMFVILIYKYSKWFNNFSRENRATILKAIFSSKTINSIKEVISESILHLKIYKTNPVLGFMHMSLAFGWFLLIIGGKIESWYFTGNFTNPIWFPIFLRYFHPVTSHFALSGFFKFFMDFALLLVLSGLTIALFKRVRKKVVGLKNTTNHDLWDKTALLSLWAIFPLRLLAESVSAAVNGGGGFLTGGLGFLFAIEFAVKIELGLWYVYSFSLGFFFIVLPFSRYLHIPTEMVLIFLRNWGVKPEPGFKPHNGIQAFEVHSCSGCGICLDVCPAVNKTDYKFQSVYFVKYVRNKKGFEKLANLCLNCGQCDAVCPVGINLDRLRSVTRHEIHKNSFFYHSYLPGSMVFWRETTRVILFTGCMGRLNPKTTVSFKNLLNEANISFIHMDEYESICCGRPMEISGVAESSATLIERNRERIMAYHGNVLVTTCPVCYKIFNSARYNLDIPVMHHSGYLWQLIESGLIVREKSIVKMAYHDPCELGRGSNCYEPPREILNRIGNLQSLKREREMSMCCGNNLGSIALSENERKSVTTGTVNILTQDNPDVVVTACPMCKKTLQNQCPAIVADLAEILWETHPINIHKKHEKISENLQKEVVNCNLMG